MLLCIEIAPRLLYNENGLDAAMAANVTRNENQEGTLMKKTWQSVLTFVLLVCMVLSLSLIHILQPHLPLSQLRRITQEPAMRGTVTKASYNKASIQ